MTKLELKEKSIEEMMIVLDTIVIDMEVVELYSELNKLDADEKCEIVACSDDSFIFILGREFCNSVLFPAMVKRWETLKTNNIVETLELLRQLDTNRYNQFKNYALDTL